MRSLVVSLCAVVTALFLSPAFAQGVGYQWQGKCYSSAAAVEQAACDSFTGVNEFGPVRCLGADELASPDASGDSFQVSVQIATSPTGSTSKTFPFYQPSCDPTVNPTDFPWNLSLGDGAAIAGAIAAVLLSAWGMRTLVRALHTDGEALD